MVITAKAPGVIKLFGEHAVVYGKLSVAIAISIYADARVDPTNTPDLTIAPLYADISSTLSEARLRSLLTEYKSMDITEYNEKNQDLRGTLAYATIASRLVEENANVFGKTVSITCDIPIKKGCASSTACLLAFTIALIRASGIKLDDEKIIDIARDGERVITENKNAGNIDVNTSYYGGYVSVSGKNVAREPINTELPLLIVDTGPKQSTSEMVGKVAKLYRERNKYAEGLMADIEKCSKSGLIALQKGNIRSVGLYMYINQDALEKLGVSSESLDKCVKIAKECNALGAKLSGGGGGGIAIVLTDGKASDLLVQKMEKETFKVYTAPVSLKGAKDL